MNDMNQSLRFDKLAIVEISGDLFRNIVSIGTSQDLFDDLSESPADWALAQVVEDQVKPHLYESRTPIIHRPFEDAEWCSVIEWPFKNWQESRFSDGSYGVWYGSAAPETTVYETAYHWLNGLLSDAGFIQDNVVIERKLYSVACSAALLDFRSIGEQLDGLIHKTDYTYAQRVGARLHKEGHPGLATWSARLPKGENFAIFNPDVLSNPRHHSQLTYRLKGDRIIVEKQPGTTWLDLDTMVF